MRNGENGRSMVEMIGVLAIIGVLSIGGIAGYTRAMRKHRANDILSLSSMLFVSANSPDATNSCLELANTNLPKKSGGIDINMTADADDPHVYIQMNTKDFNSICTLIEDSIPARAGYEIGQCGQGPIPTCDDL